MHCFICYCEKEEETKLAVTEKSIQRYESNQMNEENKIGD